MNAHVDSVLLCSLKEVVLDGVDVLDDGNVDRGESARAVDLFGGHGCGCVNTYDCVDLFEGLETIPKGNPTRASTRSTFMQGCRFRPVPNWNLIQDRAYPRTQVSAKLHLSRAYHQLQSTSPPFDRCNNSHNHENC